MTIAEALQACALFKDFTETGIKIFASISAEKTVPANAPIFVENMVGESLFILKSGVVRITQRTDKGEIQLATLGTGEHFGELALLAPSVRLVSAVAATQCEVLEISQRDFIRLQPQKPQACLKLSTAIAADFARRFVETRDLMRDFLAWQLARGK